MVMHRRSKSLGKVIKSINADDGRLCVDVFQRPDGTFGYEEYRMDPESAEGWFPIGFYSGKVFTAFETTMQDAINVVTWLEPQID